MTDKHDPYSLSDWLNYLSRSEVDFLTALAMRLPANPVIINIGAGGGTSALTLLSARHDALVCTIDIESGITPWGGLENERLILEASGVAYLERYRAIHGDSKDIGKAWTEAPVDMVFVDGGHSYAECTGDINAWWPHLKAGGVMALHDYKKVEAWAALNPTLDITPELIAETIKPYPGVDNAVDELLLHRYPLVDTVNTLIAFIK